MSRTLTAIDTHPVAEPDQWEVDPRSLVMAPPFSDLFPIASTTYNDIVKSMREHGFEGDKPITVWRSRNTVIDGHTRLRAAIEIGLDLVPIHRIEFADEQAAFGHAVRNQRLRRPTSPEILKIIERFDRPGRHGAEPGGRGNQYTGGKVPLGTLPLSAGEPAQTAEETAEKTGFSTKMVQKARVVLKDPEAKQAVEEGVMTVNRAHQAVVAKKRAAKAEAPAKPKKKAKTRDKYEVLNFKAGEPTPVSRPARPETTPEDEAYLESLPARAGVAAANRRKFDDDALIHRAVAPILEKLREAVEDAVGFRSTGQMSLLYRAIFRLSEIPPARAWDNCSRCKGECATCKACHCLGYRIPGF